MADLKNIALTVEATQTVNDLKGRLGISDQMDLIRLGFAYAIDNNVAVNRDGSLGTRGGSNYDTGGLDRDSLMAETVKIYYPEEEVLAEPYRAVETLMNKGVLLLGEHWTQGVIGSVSDLVERPTD
ncbi:hypothetical protein ACWEPM_00240 [Streptomyces sp. NPDC004244]